MYDQVETGPLYEQVARSMSTYRSIAARMQNAKASTQGKLDRQLERWGEKIGMQLEELTDQERIALCCWQEGKTPGTFEVDHAEITDRPYVSIRKESSWAEEIDREQERDAERQVEDADSTGKLKAFLAQLDADNDDF